MNQKKKKNFTLDTFKMVVRIVWIVRYVLRYVSKITLHDTYQYRFMPWIAPWIVWIAFESYDSRFMSVVHDSWWSKGHTGKWKVSKTNKRLN